MKTLIDIQTLGHNARKALDALASSTADQRNTALIKAADELENKIPDIIAANKTDYEASKERGLSPSFLDRLMLDEKRIKSIAATLREIAEQPDVLGRTLSSTTRPNGMVIEKVSIPIGVIGIIYESRPNVTADAAALCIKSGNAAILRGGSDSLNSSAIIADCMRHGLKSAGLSENCVQLIKSPDRSLVGAMLTAVGLIDVIIPRGGKDLTKRVIDESRIPTILHLDGNCHIYIHEKADAKMAEDVIINAKMRRTGVCGAAESIVIDETISKKILPQIAEKLIALGCEIRGDEKAISTHPQIKPANEEDWATEYLAPIISVKTVSSIDEAIQHINTYGSHHTDSIITEDKSAAERFLQKIDSAIVMHNTSTQFADGGEFGLGGEIGISTGRLHARGPVGAAELTTYKYIVKGSGQTRPG